MEMAQTKLVSIIFASLLVCSCCGSHSFTWQSYKMDGHRTGVSAPNADNVKEALGTVENGVYTAPNGKIFTEGSVVAVAADMIRVQPEMADLKQVIARSAKEMVRQGPECELYDWIVDHLREDIAQKTGKKVDVAFINPGGVRVDLPKGDVIMDDLVSMLPFKNYLCYVALKGEDLLALFEQMAQTFPLCFSGARAVIKDRQLESVLVGGEEIDPERIYGVGTVDFLLDGGDGFNIAKNCKELDITKYTVIESMLPYAMSYGKEGRMIDYSTDGRIVVTRTE